MINRLGACRGPTPAFWGRGPLLWLVVRPALVKMDLQGKRGRVWYKWFQPPLVALCCPLKYNSARGLGGNGIAHFVTPGEGSSHLPLLGSPHRKTKNLPSCVLGFHQIPAPSLSLPGPQHAWCHNFPMFYLWCTAGTQNFKYLKELAWCRLAFLQRRRASKCCV